MTRKLIIDTDPGIDDTMAIFYALNSPEFEVTGITTVFGNAATEITTRNALKVLEIAGRTDIPVSPGAERPLAMAFQGGADVVHGSDSQGNLNLPPAPQPPLATRAPQYLIDRFTAEPGEITLVTLGPLTNLALALLIEPDIAGKIREVVMMGGNAFCPGNITPTAEANIYNDPEAADLVFGAPFPLTMVGLDVTEKIFLTAEQIEAIKDYPNARAQHLAAILPQYLFFHESDYERRGIFIHDSTTISYLLNPSLFRTEAYAVRVETMGISRGKTWPARGYSDYRQPWKDRPQVDICLEVDANAVIDMELSRLAQWRDA